jgi:Tfp pilus assembly protein PilF
MNPNPTRYVLRSVLTAATLLSFSFPSYLGAQAQRDSAARLAHREAGRLDTEGRTSEARVIFCLVGYVALYTNDLKTAEAELTKAVAMRGNDRDPFMHVLLAMTYEKLSQQDKAKALYQKAYELATSHNPPAAFARPFARKKLGTAAQ